MLAFVLFSGLFANNHIMNVDLMEARNFVTAREMVIKDNWLMPTMNDELRITKPPLPTWLTALSMKVANSDTNLMLNRIPAGFSALLLVSFLYIFARSLFKDNLSIIFSVMVLATSYMFMYMARKGTWDIYAHSFMLGGIYYLYKSLSDEHHPKYYFLVTASLIGLSFLSKGPVAFYSLLLPFIIGYALTHGLSPFKKNCKYLLLLIIVSIVISAAWPVFINITHPQTAHAIFQNETTAWFNRHIKPFWYYLQFPAMSGIWTFAALPLLWLPYIRKSIGKDKNTMMLIIWIISIVVLLSVIPEKKDRYLLPVTIPMALLIGQYIRFLSQKLTNNDAGKTEKVLLRIYLGLSILIGLLSIVASFAYFAKAGFSVYLTFMMIVAIGMLAMLIKSFRDYSGTTFFYSVILIFCTSINIIPQTASLYLHAKDFMSLIDIRECAAKEDYTLYSTSGNLKVIWGIGRSATQIPSKMPEKMIIENTALLLSDNEYSSKNGYSFQRMCTTKPEENQKVWSLYKVQKTAP